MRIDKDDGAGGGLNAMFGFLGELVGIFLLIGLAIGGAIVGIIWAVVHYLF